MLYLAELMGLFLVGYGIWFAGKGVQRAFGFEIDWWRPLRNKKRYPYPVAGTLLGVCFVVMGLVFALNNVWVHARRLAYVGGALFGLVLLIGIVQPRFLHPRWYGRLQDRFGKEGMMRLKRAALQVEEEEWSEMSASEASFDKWVDRTMPGQMPRPSRGYKRNRDRRS